MSVYSVIPRYVESTKGLEVVVGGMRLSCPDDNTFTSDHLSPALDGTNIGISPVQYPSTSFPGVHRALYAVQGDRLGQASDIDISSLLQLPQYYWNNWDQWMSTAVEDRNQPDIDSLGNPAYISDSIWNMPMPASQDTGIGGLDSLSYEASTNPESQSQAMVTSALLRYMMEGTQIRP